MGDSVGVFQLKMVVQVDQLALTGKRLSSQAKL